jgi:hypothetical protein
MMGGTRFGAHVDGVPLVDDHLLVNGRGAIAMGEWARRRPPSRTHYL